jgi:hypothetical protein
MICLLAVHILNPCYSIYASRNRPHDFCLGFLSKDIVTISLRRTGLSFFKGRKVVKNKSTQTIAQEKPTKTITPTFVRKPSQTPGSWKPRTSSYVARTLEIILRMSTMNPLFGTPECPYKIYCPHLPPCLYTLTGPILIINPRFLVVSRFNHAFLLIWSIKKWDAVPFNNLL